MNTKGKSMTYKSMTEIASSQSLVSRIAAAAAQEGAENPTQWAQKNALKLATQPGWADAWNYAKDTITIGNLVGSDVGTFLGNRNDVITDGMILASVQPLIQAESGGISRVAVNRMSPGRTQSWALVDGASQIAHTSTDKSTDRRQRDRTARSGGSFAHRNDNRVPYRIVTRR